MTAKQLLFADTAHARLVKLLQARRWLSSADRLFPLRLFERYG